MIGLLTVVDGKVWLLVSRLVFDVRVVRHLAVFFFRDLFEWVLAERTGVADFGPVEDAGVAKGVPAGQAASHFDELFG
jgi:hypothetical protein